MAASRCCDRKAKHWSQSTLASAAPWPPFRRRQGLAYNAPVAKPELTEKDFTGVAEKALAGDRAGAVDAAVTVLATAATGSPLVGVVAGKGARALATAVVDRATERFLEAGREIDEQRARVAELQLCMLDVLGPRFEALQDREDERFLQLVRYLDRNVASAEGQAALHEDHERQHDDHAELLAELRELREELRARLEGQAAAQSPPIPFEGPGSGPATPVEFFSAEEELEELKAKLEGEQSAVCVVVHGMGGVGKTTLARQFVAVHGEELFPDGVAWLDADDLSVDMPRACALFGFRKGDRDLTVQEASQWLGRNLRERRALLVVDSVDLERIDVTSLPFPGSRCRTLLTSRDVMLHRKLGQTSLQLPLGEWAPARSRKFLRRAQEEFVQEPDEDLDALAEFVGHLPLALALLAVHPSMSPGTTAKELLNGLGTAPVETIDEFAALSVKPGVVQTFGAAWHALSDQDKIVLRALCVCAHGTRTEIVAATAGVGAIHTKKALDRLFRISLAEHHKDAASPWTLHDVVLHFVRAQGDVTELEAAHQRWVERYLADADPADREAFEHAAPEGIVVVERLTKNGEATDANRIAEPLFQRFTNRGEHGRGLVLAQWLVDATEHRSVNQATWLLNLCICHRALGKTLDAVRHARRALDLFTALRLPAGQAGAIQLLGSCETIIGNIPEAIGLYWEALSLFQKLGLLQRQAETVGGLGTCYRLQGHVHAAIDLHQCALALHKRDENRSGQTQELSELGVCHRHLGSYGSAIAMHERALALADEVGDLGRQCDEHLQLGVCFADQGLYDRAVQHLEQALRLARTLERYSAYAAALGNLGLCYRQAGDIPKAIEYLKLASSMFQQSASMDGHATQVAQLGLCYQTLGNIPKAVTLLARALEMFMTTRNPERQAMCLSQLGVCYLLMGDLTRAVDSHQKALVIEQGRGNLLGQAHQLGELGLCYLKRGDRAKAKDYLQRAIALFERLSLPDDYAYRRLFEQALRTLD